MPLTLSLQLFAYKKGLPRDLDIALYSQFLTNLYWETALRPINYPNPAILKHVRCDAPNQGFFERSLDLILFLLPAYQGEGKSHFVVGLGCAGVRHRSVSVAESLAQTLAKLVGPVSIRYRELDKSAGSWTVPDIRASIASWSG